ncbi:response regulator transcription factor [Sediminitomix flava]|uniref:LuxR family two component transcriptional regulator n=1 Tax=Sediminitomix flava TaxID=379075 RepID=A0A315ZVV9_SEDFL|nr:response regulator transcription factor [Sediminitomix flava]PWJ40803.1 LuxR family two component transcriptional regulator [Sediminitomix flava]
MKTKLLIVDDHKMFIQGIRSLLEGEESIEIVGEAFNGIEAVNFVKGNEVDILIMDVNMPEMDGIEATEQILKLKPNTKIIALSMHNEKRFIANMMKKGAHGYVLKNTEKEELIEAIHTVINDDNYLSKEASDVLLSTYLKRSKMALMTETLSDREVDVLKEIASGFTTNEIADRLFITKNTVETHRKNLLLKLQARNTAELVNIAFRKGIIS